MIDNSPAMASTRPWLSSTSGHCELAEDRLAARPRVGGAHDHLALEPIRAPGFGRHHLALFIRDLGGGGVQRTTLTLARALAARGHRVDLILCQAVGPLRDSVPGEVRAIELQPDHRRRTRLLPLAVDPAGIAQLMRPILLRRKLPREIPYLPDLAAYLRRERPDALLAATPYLNLLVLWAKRLARSRTRVLVSERNNVSFRIEYKPRQRCLPPLLRRMYMTADVITTVSHAVGDDLAATTALPRELITTIYNPVVPPDLPDKAREPIDHRWFAPGAPPVVLGAGRLTPTKDFPTLLRAFAQVRKMLPARLMILGEGKNAEEDAARRIELLELATELGVREEIAMPGFMLNPFPYMARASVFVLSSVWEGFGNVLVEALACGCPVVSTDCPDGPREILDGGRYGRLIPVGDHGAMAEAILETLRAPPEPSTLHRRAASFSVDRAVEQYLAALFAAS
jgi:glycosyltransferase involved in cell wall biosynthesis